MRKINRGSVYLLVGFFTMGLLAIPHASAHNAAQRQLEQKVQELEDMLRSVKSELQQVRSESANAVETRAAEAAANEARIEAQEAKAEAIAAREEAQKIFSGNKKHRVFFRGGWARANELRNGATLESRVVPVGAQDQADRDAWYIGAGLDFHLTDDVWGLMPRTELLAEIMFEYKNFKTGVNGNALANEPSQLAGGADNPRAVKVDQFTLTAAPKIKFMEGSKFRPWIIPAGLAIHVLSPPTESVTYLDTGVMFGGGAEYNIWKDIYLGADARYHLTVGNTDGAKIDGLTLGGYLGIGF